MDQRPRNDALFNREAISLAHVCMQLYTRVHTSNINLLPSKFLHEFILMISVK